MRARGLTPWIIATVLLCAGVGAWFGHRIGGGGPGIIALISATCGVLGSFVPGTVLRLAGRRRHGQRPRQGAA